MPVCCRCNGSGRCTSCVCVKAGRPCTDCLPSRKGHCCNNNFDDLSTPPAPDVNGHSLSTPETPATANEAVNSRLAPNSAASSTTDSSNDNAAAMSPANTCNNTETSTDEVGTLPPFRAALSMSSSWGDLSGDEFMKAIDDAYSQVVHWRPILFKIPSGACGKQFVVELTRLFNAFALENDLESIALKAAMALPSLMLQKPHVKSKTKEHISCLQRRLSLWEKGDISNLLREGRALQKLLASSQSPRRVSTDNSQIARRFSKMMVEGRIRAALKILSDSSDTGLLSLDDIVDDASGKTVRAVLEEKHPDPRPAHPDALLTDAGNDSFHPAIFDGITGESIRSAALHTQGAAGPSGLDALNWRRLCTSFGQKSNDLCTALAAVARRMCTTLIDPSTLLAYTACRLILLNKCPGVRPSST